MNEGFMLDNTLDWLRFPAIPCCGCFGSCVRGSEHMTVLQCCLSGGYVFSVIQFKRRPPGRQAYHPPAIDFLGFCTDSRPLACGFPGSFSGCSI
jgi:hypothetical protein